MKLAITNLASVPDYPADTAFISNHLSVDEKDVRAALDVLLEKNLVSINGDLLQRSEASLMFVSDPLDEALLKYKKLFS